MTEPRTGAESANSEAVSAEQESAQLVAAELAQTKTESLRRLVHLRKQLRALEELRSSLVSEEMSLIASLEEARALQEEVAKRLGGSTRVEQERAARIKELDEEIAELERRGADGLRRDKELARQLVSAEAGILALKNETLFARQQLEAGHDALVRMGRKLSHRQRSR